MFKKIMVAIDGSETSREALKEARNIATSYHGTLRIVYAVADSDDTDQQAGLEMLEHAKSTVVNGIEVETRVLHAEAEYGLNGIVEAVADAANEWGADLLAMGTAHRRGLERLVIGSVAEQMVGKVDASILLVRPGKPVDYPD
jgi:nucleotide-binding universal stress UspA family protein